MFAVVGIYYFYLTILKERRILILMFLTKKLSSIRYRFSTRLFFEHR